MLQARDLTKTYASIPAVKDVTFSLESGQVLGCLGPNGSGKSTTVKMLIGLLEPTHGKVLFKGDDIRKDLVGFRKCLGYVPEEANLYPYLSGYEYLEMVAILRGMPRPQLNKKINNLLELLAMHPHRHASIAAYSKGMRQRILLTRDFAREAFEKLWIGQDEVSFTCAHVIKEVQFSVGTLDFSRATFEAACFPRRGFDTANDGAVGRYPIEFMCPRSALDAFEGEEL
jgi:ABC-type lipopolysaccharide export system ATPase subunit